MNSEKKENFALRLKASKSSLYAFVSSVTDLPQIRHTEFIKAYRARSYWLNWSKNDVEYRAYLSVTAGWPLLSIDGKQYDEHADTADGYRRTREVHRLSIDELRKYNMVEEYSPHRKRG